DLSWSRSLIALSPPYLPAGSVAPLRRDVIGASRSCRFGLAGRASRSRSPAQTAPSAASQLLHGSVERKCDFDRGSRAFGALDGDRAAQGLDAVAQPDEPGAARRIGAADAVVADKDLQNPVGWRHLDMDGRRLRVLCRVGERLCDDVVGS